MLKRWAKLIETRPVPLIVAVILVSSVLTFIGVFFHPLPKFSDPLLGFEARGSDISNRINTWKLLTESTSWSGSLSMRPNTVNDAKELANKSDLDSHKKPSDDEEEAELELINEMALNRYNHFNMEKSKMFCGKLVEDYANFIIESVDGNNLFSLSTIKSLCQLDKNLLRLNVDYYSNLKFAQNCEQKNFKSCCPSWSLANYIALINNKTSCSDIDERDLLLTKSLLELCAPFYHSFKLNDVCQEEPQLCQNTPKQCFQYENAAFNIFHYLVDSQFLKNNSNFQIKYLSVFLPIAKSTKLLDYYNELSKYPQANEELRVVAMDIGLKQALFDRCLLSDSLYLALSTAIILLLLYLYTASLVITVITILIVISSFGTAYFFYTTIFQLKFFPFINLLSLVIVIGIGCDNTFIYYKVWNCMKQDKTCVLNKIVADTLAHTLLSSFAASATTSVAFFTTFSSDITAIKCFSIFSGISVIMNFIYTFLLLPPAIVISEKSSFNCWSQIACCWKIYYFITKIFKQLFDLFFDIIIKFRCFLILTFAAISFYSIVLVLYKPKLQLPDFEEFQIFSSDHPFERYDFEFKHHFWFSMKKSESEVFTMPIRIVFGVDPTDTGDFLNPFSRGSLKFSRNFDITTSEAQIWMLKFCKELRNQSFYQPTIGPLLSNCFIETFKSWMTDLRCFDDINNIRRNPCCNSSVFPYQRNIFNYCLNNIINSLEKTPMYLFNLLPWAGPRFHKNSSEIVAAVIEYDSKFTFTHSFYQMNKFWQEVNSWIFKTIQTAPKELRSAWLVSSNLDFFALQVSLSEGTATSIVLAVAFAFISLLFTTCNLLLSFLAILTINSIIFTTISMLIILGWKLSIVESISISLAIGLAIDHTLHYTIAYKLSRAGDRISSVRNSFYRIGSSVSMGALTTILAGLVMLPSSVLAYVQIGTFLIILSSVSWIYSTFFHLSLLSLFGPKNVPTCGNNLFFSSCDDSPSSVMTNIRSTTIDSISSDKPSSRRHHPTLTISSATISSCSVNSENHPQEIHELESIGLKKFEPNAY